METTYQIAKTNSGTTIEFKDGGDRLDLFRNARNDEVTFSIPTDTADGEWDNVVIIIEADVLAMALKNAGVI